MLRRLEERRSRAQSRSRLVEKCLSPHQKLPFWAELRPSTAAPSAEASPLQRGGQLHASVFPALRAYHSAFVGKSEAFKDYYLLTLQQLKGLQYSAHAGTFDRVAALYRKVSIDHHDHFMRICVQKPEAGEVALCAGSNTWEART